MTKLIKQTQFNKFGNQLEIFEAKDNRHYIHVTPSNGEKPYYEWLNNYDFETAWKPLYL